MEHYQHYLNDSQLRITEHDADVMSEELLFIEHVLNVLHPIDDIMYFL